MGQDQDIAEQLEKHLFAPCQTWLMGAGVSRNANIPLMYPLTDRVLSAAVSDTFAGDDVALCVIEYIRNDLPDDAHIEIFLTYLADMISLSERSKSMTVTMGDLTAHKSKLNELHLGILDLIASTLRWGFVSSNPDQGTDEQIGSFNNSLVRVDEHKAFVDALFNVTRAGVEKHRGAIHFFTTNYDTLIEDALALNQISYVDGFSGGAVAFWKGFGEELHKANQAVLIKLHGSIDWFRSRVSHSPLMRVRNGDRYPVDEQGQVMIYPQATKYANAQADPFLGLFQRFRSRLAHSGDHTLLVAGYSFGDEHINADIEIAMEDQDELTIIVFTDEPLSADDDEGSLPSILQMWQKSRFADRLYIVSPKGLYRGMEGPVFVSAEGGRNWWTYDGITKLLRDGFPADVQEALQ